MASSHMKLAALDEARTQKLRALEERLGIHMLAWEPEVHLADLSDEQISEIRAAEEELGVVLVAYQRD